MRILWYYIRLLVIPSVNELGLFHDDIPLSTNLFTPYTTFLSVVGILALLIFALIRIRRYPIISFAILWFLAGHLLESTVFGLELVYEHRNYLPSFGIMFALCYFLISHTPKANSSNKIWILLICATAIMLGFATWSRANTWKDTLLLAESMAERHPLSPRANDFAARVVLAEKNDIFAAVRYTLRGLNANPREVGFYIDLRILLASLAVEINDGLTRTNRARLLDTSNINVQGLPEGVESKVENNEIHLVYHNSTDAQIHQLLKTQPISVHGIISLENLSRCIVNPSSTCLSLEKIALSWFNIAAENIRTSKTYRSIIQIETAKLYARAGDDKRALDYASQAMHGSPDMLSYQLAKTEYLIRLGRLAEARTMLDRFEKTESEDFIQYSANKAALEELSKMYEKAIKTTTDAPSGMRKD
jgi:protein O-mannosyl-transferase